YYAQQAQGTSQLDWTVTAYLEPDQFRITYAEPAPNPSLSCTVAGLIAPATGTLRGYRGLSEIRHLESFVALKAAVQPGQRIERTVNDLTYPLRVILMHEDPAVVERDAHTIRYLDGGHFYDIQ
ncbi:biotin carboxylase, partial [Nocardia sp. 2]|nr:biotin carboxylase [Nocardia acididurans]